VIAGLIRHLTDHKQLIELTQLHDAEAAILEKALTKVNDLKDPSNVQSQSTIQILIRTAVRRIDIQPGKLTMMICPSSLKAVLLDQPALKPKEHSSDDITLSLPFQLRRRGVEAKLIVGNDTAVPTIDPKLVETIRNANRWLRLLTAGEVSSVDALAELDGIPASEISRVLPFAFLAPDITKAILTGKQPVDLTTKRLKRIGKIPACWSEQRQLLRMSS